MKLYRAVSRAEADQVRRTGRLEVIPGSMEGKWLSERLEDARTWGTLLRRISGEPHDNIVVVTAPDDLAARLFRLERLDGIGAARFAEADDLPMLTVDEVAT